MYMYVHVHTVYAISSLQAKGSKNVKFLKAMLSVNVNLFAFNSSGRSALPLEPENSQGFLFQLYQTEILVTTNILKTCGGNSCL